MTDQDVLDTTTQDQPTKGGDNGDRVVMLKRQFDKEMARARKYVDDPDILRKEVAVQEEARDRNILGMSYPDPFHYRMLLSKGFLRFPERLENYLRMQQNLCEPVCECKPCLLDVEPESRCNFRCIMCARAKDGVGAKQRPSMPFEDFRVIMDDNPQCIEVKVQGVGEPLLNPDLFDMIAYAVSRDTWVRTTVNGSLLHKNENYKRLVDAGISEVQISVDGADKEVFERIRRGSDFDLVRDNVTMLNRYVAGKDRDYTRMWVLLQKDNRHQLFDFVELASRMGFRRLTFSVALMGWGEEDSFDDLKVGGLSRQEEQDVLDLAERHGVAVSYWQCTDRFRVGSPKTICHIPFMRTYISSGMKIVPCGVIGYKEDVNFGSAFEFNERWNSKQYQAFRAAHLAGKIPAFCRECYEPAPDKPLE